MYCALVGVAVSLVWGLGLFLSTPKNSPWLAPGEQHEMRHFDKRTKNLRATLIPGAMDHPWNRMIRAHDRSRLLAHDSLMRRFFRLRLFAWLVAVLILASELLAWYWVLVELAAKNAHLNDTDVIVLLLVPLVAIAGLWLPSWTVIKFRDHVARRRAPLAWSLLERGRIVDVLGGVELPDEHRDGGPSLQKHAGAWARLQLRATAIRRTLERRMVYVSPAVNGHITPERARALLAPFEAKLVLDVFPPHRTSTSERMLWKSAGEPRLTSVLAEKADLLDAGANGIPVERVYAWLDTVTEGLVFRDTPPPRPSPARETDLLDTISRRRARSVLGLGILPLLGEAPILFPLVGVATILIVKLWGPIVVLVGLHPALVTASMTAIITGVFAVIVTLVTSWLKRRSALPR